MLVISSSERAAGRFLRGGRSPRGRDVEARQSETGAGFFLRHREAVLVADMPRGTALGHAYDKNRLHGSGRR